MSIMMIESLVTQIVVGKTDGSPEVEKKKKKEGGQATETSPIVRRSEWASAWRLRFMGDVEFNFNGGSTTQDSSRTFERKQIYRDPGTPMSYSPIGLSNDPPVLFGLRSGTGMGYLAGIRAEGELPISLGEKWIGPTKFTFSAEANWQEIMGYRRSFNMVYRGKLENSWIVNKTWLGYSGVNLLGLKPFGDMEFVKDENYRSRNNPDITDLAFLGNKFGFKIPGERLQVTPFVGFEGRGAYIYYFLTFDGYHFEGEAILSGGADVVYNTDWRFSLEVGRGNQYEEQFSLSRTTGDSAVTSPNISDIGDALKNSDIKEVLLFRGRAQTPPLLGNTAFVGYFDYKNYKSWDGSTVSQYDGGMRALFGERWDLGVEYAHNPVLWVGAENDRITLDSQIKIKPSSKSRIYAPMWIVPNCSVYTIDSAQGIDGGTAYSCGIGFRAYLGYQSQKKPSGTRTPVGP